MAQVIMGADVAAVLREEIAKDLADLNGYVPRIAVVRVGEREDDIARFYSQSATIFPESGRKTEPPKRRRKS